MESLKCPACKTVFIENKETCTKCNFPFNGSEQEKSVHIGQFIMKKGVVTDASDFLEKTKNILYALAGLLGIFLIILFSTGNYTIMNLIINGSLFIAFVFCGFFLEKNPILFTVLPLFLVIGVFLWNYLLFQIFSLQDIIVKLLIVIGLGYSIYLQLMALKFKEKYTEIDENE